MSSSRFVSLRSLWPQKYVITQSPSSRVGRLFSTSRLCEIRQVLMDELHGHRSLSDRRGDPLDRAMTGVPCREDAGYAGLECMGTSVELPRRPESAVREIAVCEDEPAVVPSEDVLQPLGVGLRPDQDEKTVGPQRLVHRFSA